MDHRPNSLLVPLPVSLGRVVPILDDQVLRPVVISPGKVRLQDVLGALSVPRLCIQRSARHMWYHSVASTLGVGCIAERVLLGRRLREPDITTVAAEVARFQGFRDVLFDNNGTASGVDEP